MYTVFMKPDHFCTQWPHVSFRKWSLFFVLLHKLLSKVPTYCRYHLRESFDSHMPNSFHYHFNYKSHFHPLVGKSQINSVCVHFLRGHGIRLFILLLNTQMLSKKRSLILQLTGPSCASDFLLATECFLLSLLSNYGCHFNCRSGMNMSSKQCLPWKWIYLEMIVHIKIHDYRSWIFFLNVWCLTQLHTRATFDVVSIS